MQKNSQKLISVSHSTIHHHYAKTRWNSIKKQSFAHPHLAAETRTLNPRLWGGSHSTISLFFFTPHPYPYLSFFYPTELVLYTSLFPTLEWSAVRVEVSLSHAKKKSVFRIKAWMFGARPGGDVSYVGCFLCTKKCTPTELL